MRYKVDLSRYMSDCDANYVRLMKLFPEIVQGDERRIGIHHVEDSVLTLSVLEQTPYTTLVKLAQKVDHETGKKKNSDKSSPWFRLPVLTLRLYHDAKVSEVVWYEGNKRVFPRYEYPNKRMYQRGEKAQWNQFLSEWLAHCLEYGYDMAEPSYGAASQ